MSGLRLLAVDSHDFCWRVACDALTSDPRFERVYVVKSVDQAINCMDAIEPDVLLVDLTMPGTTTLDVVSKLTGATGGPLLIAACEKMGDADLSLAIAIGARACVGRDISPSRLAAVISEVVSGGLPLEREIACRPVLLNCLLTELQRRIHPTSQDVDTLPECPLTARERVILDLVADGRANKEVALTLDIAERTVKNHMANILDKLDARSRAHAVRMGVENRWICQEELEEDLLELAA